MAEGGSDVSKAQLKHDLAQLGHNLYNIDLQIKKLKSQGNQQGQIATLKEAKLQIQKGVVNKANSTWAEGGTKQSGQEGKEMMAIGWYLPGRH